MHKREYSYYNWRKLNAETFDEMPFDAMEKVIDYLQELIKGEAA